MSEPTGQQFLAQQIDGALKAAEKQMKREGFVLYPFIVGYLLGSCADEDQAAFNERIERLVSP